MGISTGANVMRFSDEDLAAARSEFIRKQGRPSMFNPELAAEICARIEAGETLTKICSDPGMPWRGTVNDWAGKLPQFANALACARKRSAGSMVDHGLEMLDSLAVPKLDDEGRPVPLDMVTVRLTEMRHKARFELAKCYDRDTFGDKSKLDISGKIEHSVGGILESIMGGPTPLILEAEEVEPAGLIAYQEDNEALKISQNQPEGLPIF